MGLTVALAGGVGAAKLLRGLVQVIPSKDLVIIGNTGDDFELHGLHISPDLDIVMYTLAEIVDKAKGWGVSGDTFNCLNMLGGLGRETWFKLGDRDLAFHIIRTEMLKDGTQLSQVTTELCKMLGLDATLVPMTDDPVRTKIVSGSLTLDFQEYFVKRSTKDIVTGVIYEGSENARPAPGILEAIKNAERIIICPSNPILSIAPILSVPKINDAIKKSEAHVIGVSPIVGGRAIKGPTTRIMTSMKLDASTYGIAKYYQRFINHLIIDTVDKKEKEPIERLGVKTTVTSTIMRNLEDSITLANVVMNTYAP